MLTFTSPFMLAGLAALALPIAAHLLHRHSQRQIVFPTIDLLLASAASQSRLFRLRRLILLALRCLMIALAVLAFSRPLWRRGAEGTASGDRPEALVMLIDLSASSRQTHGGVTAAARLQAAAERALDSLRGGVDHANLVIVDAQPRAALPRLSRNLPALREEIRRLAPTYERADLHAALALAGKLLAEHDGPRRLIVLSDLQAANWQETLQANAASELVGASVRTTVLDFTAPLPPNAALSQPRVSPGEPLVSQPAQLVAQVANFSADPKEVEVRAMLDGQSLASQTLTLAAGERREAAFEATLADTRLHEVIFQIGSDGCDFDNRLFLTVQAKSRLPVAIVSDDDPHEPGAAAYYLTRALAPHGGEEDRFEPRHLAGRDVTSGSLEGASAVFVGYLAPLSPERATTLLDYVRRGGGLALFMGEGPVAANLAQLDAAVKSGAAPWEVGAARRLDPSAAPLEISSGQWRSPLLRDFDEQSQLALRLIRLRQVWTILRTRPESEILLTYSDGTPALAMRRVGEGRLLMANFTPAAAGGDLAKHAAFVALVQSLAKELRPAKSLSLAAAPGVPYGHPTEFPKQDGLEIRVIGPNGAEAPSLATVLPSGNESVQVRRLALPGFYRFERSGQLLDVAAINVDPRESDLKRLSAKGVSQALGADSVSANSPAAAAWTSPNDRHGRPLWGWMFAMAMLFAGLELLLIGLWRR